MPGILANLCMLSVAALSAATCACSAVTTSGSLSASLASSVAPSNSASPSSSGSNSGPTADSDTAKAIISYHNQVRANHSAPSLSWNQTLADYAQNFLNNGDCQFKHSGGPYGENVAGGWPDFKSAQTAWYNEGAKYNYSNPGFSEQTGHFTQVVWKSTTEIGCASRTNCANGPLYVCEYYVPGNVQGEFPENVLPH